MFRFIVVSECYINGSELPPHAPPTAHPDSICNFTSLVQSDLRCSLHVKQDRALACVIFRLP